MRNCIYYDKDKKGYFCWCNAEFDNEDERYYFKEEEFNKSSKNTCPYIDLCENDKIIEEL